MIDSQMPKKLRRLRMLPKVKKVASLNFVTYVTFLTFVTYATSFSFAQEDLSRLKESYFNQHRYSEFVDYLESLRGHKPKPELSYYIALTRHEQLRYLEETQSWGEYFDRADEYRGEFIREAQNAIESTSEKDPIFIYAKCLLWEFYKDMQDEQEEGALVDLLNAVSQYSELSEADLPVIKYVADKLSSYGNRIKSQRVYNIYLERLITSLQENKEERLVSLAKQLAHSDNGVYNPYFAEEVFKKIEELNPDLILDEQTQYLRAYNLEKIKQYKDAYPEYQTLIQKYPRSSHCVQALFKIGVISAYILQDIPKACDYFTELTQGFPSSPNVIASLYQLGLISQYQGDIAEALEYYNALLEKAEAISYREGLINEAKLRLKEIEESKPLEFSLKTFMDAAFVDDKGILYAPNVDIKVQQFNLIPNQDVQISSFALPAESGCMLVNLEYLWSGDLGIALPENTDGTFTTRYISPSTKLIQLVVVTPAGILGGSLIFLDVAY